MINHVLREDLDISVVVYLDDILIFSTTLEQHRQHVRRVLQRLQEARLLVEVEKSRFHRQEVDFLGFTIRPGQVRMQQSKIEGVRDWPAPKTVKGIREFLGFTNFYRRFIRNYGKIAAPLTDLTKKDVEFEWTSQADEAFRQIKGEITKEPILRDADPEKAFEVETDASDYALGGQLGQRDADGQLHPIAFYSKKLHGPELNYQIHDKELMAIIEACKEWRHYLSGTKHQVTVYTDHKNLTYFMTTKELNKRQIRWAEFLSEFDLKIIYRKGSENGRADALSRREDYQQDSKIPELHAIFQQNEDGSLQQTARQIGATYQIRENDKWIKELRKAQKHETLIGKDFRKNGRFTEYRQKIYVPKVLRRALVQRIHEAPAHGHQGIARTYHRIRQNYDWPGLRGDIQAVISECNTCAKAKAARHKPYGELQPLPVPQKAWDSIALDFIVKLPLSKEPISGARYDSILVITDRFTKFGHFIPYKEASTATDLAYSFLRNIVSLHGMPREIISDRGSVFVSKFWQGLITQLGVQHKLSTAYHPQTDGQTERLNQTLEQYLRSYVNYQQDDWVGLLPLAQFAYNSARTETTKVSPFYANYGFQPEAYREPGVEASSEQARLKAEQIPAMQGMLRKELEFVRERMTKYANQRRLKGPTLKEGGVVYLLRRNIRTKRPSDKLDYKKLGPFKIKRQVSTVNYELELPDGMRIHPVFHVSLLEPASPDAKTETQLETETDPDQEYEVEEILDQRWVRNQQEYLVKWKGYSQEENTWEPIKNLESCQGRIDQYHQRHPTQNRTGDPQRRRAEKGKGLSQRKANQ